MPPLALHFGPLRGRADRLTWRRSAQSQELFLAEAGGAAGVEVERRPRPRRLVARGELGVGGHGIQAARVAQEAEPAVADRDVADLVAQDDVQDLAGAGIARPDQLGLDRRRGVE